MKHLLWRKISTTKIFQRSITEREVVDVLMEKGILREDIVLGFRPPYARPYTGFASA